MAKAPRPTKTRDVFKITVRGVAATVDPGEFGPKDDIMVRRESMAAYGERVSLTGAFQQLDEQSAGLDTICLLWWVARRKAGETDESLAEALESFPTYAEAEGAIQFELVEPGAGEA